jgi:5-methyltetrahydrofolate--homocysteine methyltransferase
VKPLERKGEPSDNICLFVTTAGGGIRELAEEFKASGDFLKMHGVQALALETAEAYAELIHTQLRSMWGFPDPPEITMLERFRAEYQGKRYSFGYPACPRLEDQQLLFQALRPEEIGVELTDGCMMEPEASVSAVVFHHPQAFYYSVS